MMSLIQIKTGANRQQHVMLFANIANNESEILGVLDKKKSTGSL